MHIIRGAGINGLAGMDSASYLKQYSEKIPVLRPMLKIPRRLVLEYCAKHSIPFRTDSTNVQTDSTRNRIRLELIPYLEGMNPRIIEQLNRLAATAMKTTEFIESQVANLRDGVVQLEGNCLKVDSDKLADLPFALAAELLRSEVNTLVANAENFTQERLTSLLEKVQNGEKNFRLNLGGNLYAWGSGDILRIGMHEGFDSLYPVLEARAKLKLKLDDTTILNNFWSIESMVTPLVIGQDYKSPDTSAFIDASKVAGDLEIRPVTASDEFVPFGRTSLTNVIEYLKKNQIPAIDARKWPVLCDESGVVWVIGRRLDDRFKITADTKSILRLNLLRQHQALD